MVKKHLETPYVELKRAWSWRKQAGLLNGKAPAVRVFYGPGEGTGILENVAVDRFASHYWVTVWEDIQGNQGREAGALVVDFLKSEEDAGLQSVVLLNRPEKGVPEDPYILHGAPPSGRFEVEETGRYLVQLLGAKHPGLFLDHRPLRNWLVSHARDWTVLNTFAYTGSLSVAAGIGGASHVTTLDLSKPSVVWAEQNWKLNELAADRARFIAGDVFEWLPRLKREGRKFDCVILDPPSFSRGAKGNFSTSKDLKKLHLLALDVLGGEGILISSINSANVPWARFEAEVLAAARERGMSFELLKRIDLPDTFPTAFEKPEERYLKGWILRLKNQKP
ncbi:MAG: hypothetical protein A2070_11445 [Bdellovibrionales bacterium GWC1_52_8]|nr:MAG: hypothetical protein A2Z97_12370 [Bdellovibrionales bacterium GWB1_52_6]OFZ03735.1 MAG: hypothetical protein A2X97_14350 [Bdellovibrionales bacterium GWA1_52_35]OFZ35441.1 MAG: hypothetical protein A2070_11445 [Bdellovibrionales bacterium GWC1_52_8]